MKIKSFFRKLFNTTDNAVRCHLCYRNCIIYYQADGGTVKLTIKDLPKDCVILNK